MGAYLIIKAPCERIYVTDAIQLGVVADAVIAGLRSKRAPEREPSACDARPEWSREEERQDSACPRGAPDARDAEQNPRETGIE